jgi:uncharacterized DUF497 family protein
MKSGRFEWDDAKAASNKSKHRVSFDDACKALDDDNVSSSRIIVKIMARSGWSRLAMRVASFCT